MRLVFFIAAPALWLASCSQDTEASVESEPDAASAVESEAFATDEGRTAQADSIPTAIQGRWGLVTADCTSTRGDAKGLIDISENRIEYYESRGTIDAIADVNDDRIRATYAMTGEGMTWTTDMELALTDGGSSLVRREFGEDAMVDPLTYTKCA